jgi:hypothetical protein
VAFFYKSYLRLILEWGGAEMGYIGDLRKIVGSRPLNLSGSVGILVDKRGRLMLQQRRFRQDHGAFLAD